jgi:hypothetical protein
MQTLAAFAADRAELAAFATRTARSACRWDDRGPFNQVMLNLVRGQSKPS